MPTEDEGSMFLLNFVIYLQVHMALDPEDQHRQEQFSVCFLQGNCNGTHRDAVPEALSQKDARAKAFRNLLFQALVLLG
jgi:hypothetical protein